MLVSCVHCERTTSGRVARITSARFYSAPEFPWETTAPPDAPWRPALLFLTDCRWCGASTPVRMVDPASRQTLQTEFHPPWDPEEAWRRFVASAPTVPKVSDPAWPKAVGALTDDQMLAVFARALHTARYHQAEIAAARLEVGNLSLSAAVAQADLLAAQRLLDVIQTSRTRTWP